MPYPPRPPTPQAVGAALKRAGFPRSEPTMGLRQHTAGYQVRKGRSIPDSVEVRWLPHSLDDDGDLLGRRRTRALLRYADALLVAGFRPQVDEPGEKVTVYARRS